MPMYGTMLTTERCFWHLWAHRAKRKTVPHRNESDDPYYQHVARGLQPVWCTILVHRTTQTKNTTGSAEKRAPCYQHCCRSAAALQSLPRGLGAEASLAWRLRGLGSPARIDLGRISAPFPPAVAHRLLLSSLTAARARPGIDLWH